MPSDVSKNVVVRIRAQAGPEISAALNGIAEGATRGGAGVKKLTEEIDRLKSPAATTGQVVSNIFLDMRKNSLEAVKKTDELAASFKRLGISVSEVQGMSRELGKQMGLTGEQITQAMAKAGMGGGGAGGFAGVGGLMSLLRGGALGMGIYGMHAAADRGSQMLQNFGEGVAHRELMAQRPDLFSAQEHMRTLGAGDEMSILHHKLSAREATALQPLYTPMERIQEARLAPEFASIAETQRRQALTGQRRMEAESLKAAQIGIREPFLAEQRATQEQAGLARSQARTDQRRIRQGEAYGLEQSQWARSMAFGMQQNAPLLYSGVGGGARKLQLEEMQEQWGQIGIRQGERLGQAAGAVDTAQEARVRAADRVVDAERELDRILKKQFHTTEEVTNANTQRTNRSNELVQAEQRVNDSLRQQALTRKEITREEREMVHAQLQQVRSQRVGFEDQAKDQLVELAGMDPMQRRHVLEVGKMIQAGNIGPGRAPMIRMGPGGRPQLIPGMATNLRPEDMGMAQHFFGPQVRKLMLERADKDPVLKQILPMLGAQQQAQGLKKSEKQLIDLRQQLEMKIVFDEKSVAKQMIDVAIPKIQDLMKKFVKAAEEEMKQKLERQQMIAAWQKLASGLGAGGGG